MTRKRSDNLPVSRQRRDFLQATAAAVLGSVAPGTIWAATTGTAPGPHRALLDALCDAIIPDTDTPGAVAAGAPAFVETAIAHGLERAPGDLLQRLETALDELAKKPFSSLEQESRTALLQDVDSAAMTRGGPGYESKLSQSWRILKALVVVAYYTSETGGAEELRYVLTPGRFEPDVEIGPGDRAFSSDWTGVKFG